MGKSAVFHLEDARSMNIHGSLWIHMVGPLGYSLVMGPLGQEGGVLKNRRSQLRGEEKDCCLLVL